MTKGPARTGGDAARARRDACPGALQVHDAADGRLARVRVPGGRLTPSRLTAIADCAALFGSGVIELTSRANLQVRGLRAPDAFAERIAGAGLLPSPTHERVRNIAASPLSGRGPSGSTDVTPLVEALDEVLCGDPRLAALSGRFLFAFDDGSGDMAALGADLTWTPGGPLIAGVPVAVPSLATAAPHAVAAALAAAALAFLEERGTTGAWRIGELTEGPARVAARVGGAVRHPAPTPRGTHRTPYPQATPRRPGRIPQRDGRAALDVLVPLGRLSPAQARALAAAGEPVVTPWRSVVLLDLEAEAADEAEHRLAAVGLVTDPESPWTGVTACTGRPGCAKSLADVRGDAARWVAGRDGPYELPVHWSGCERRCGRPRGPYEDRVAAGDGYLKNRDEGRA